MGEIDLEEKRRLQLVWDNLLIDGWIADRKCNVICRRFFVLEYYKEFNFNDDFDFEWLEKIDLKRIPKYSDISDKVKIFIGGRSLKLSGYLFNNCDRNEILSVIDSLPWRNSRNRTKHRYKEDTFRLKIFVRSRDKRTSWNTIK